MYSGNGSKQCHYKFLIPYLCPVRRKHKPRLCYLMEYSGKWCWGKKREEVILYLLWNNLLILQMHFVLLCYLHYRLIKDKVFRSWLVQNSFEGRTLSSFLAIRLWLRTWILPRQVLWWSSFSKVLIVGYPHNMKVNMSSWHSYFWHCTYIYRQVMHACVLSHISCVWLHGL